MDSSWTVLEQCTSTGPTAAEKGKGRAPPELVVGIARCPNERD